MMLLISLDPEIIILSGTASHDFQSEVASSLPKEDIITTYHYAHRSSDTEKARDRAAEIRETTGLEMFEMRNTTG